ncbi:MAG: glycosyltransferase family 4 protein [Spirochaetales bacterium]|nr:glycosyltransferase family 4 protein [Spirochaetales bacterium]
MRTLFIPFIDAFLPVLPLLYLFLPRSCLLSGIIFQANYAYPPAAMLERLKSALKRGLTFLYGKSGCVDRLYFLDPLAVRYWQTRGIWPFAFHSCPDPAQGRRIPRSRARKVLGLSPHLRIVASLGRQDERKGTMELIAAFAAGPGLLPDRRLVLAGEFSTGIRERLARLKEENPEVARRLIVIEGFLSDSELNLWANSADVMAVVHPAQIGSSGTLMMAALLEKPVLASDSGAIGTIAREYELGRLVRTSVPGDLVAGLEWAFSNPSIKKEAQKRLASEATEYAFKAAIAPKD